MNKIMNDNELMSYVKDRHPNIYSDLFVLFKQTDTIVYWLNTQKPFLENRSPRELLQSKPERVADLLNRIKTGDFS